jgi:hypothetical protein
MENAPTIVPANPGWQMGIFYGGNPEEREDDFIDMVPVIAWEICHNDHENWVCPITLAGPQRKWSWLNFLKSPEGKYFDLGGDPAPWEDEQGLLPTLQQRYAHDLAKAEANKPKQVTG